MKDFCQEVVYIITLFGYHYDNHRDFVPRTFKTTDEKRVNRLIRIAAYRGLDFVVNTIDLRNLDLGINNLDINSEIYCGDDKCDYDYSFGYQAKRNRRLMAEYNRING